MVTLVLCPRGRGRWKTYLMTIEGQKQDMFTFSFKAGDPIDVGGRAFWIVEVRL